MAEWNLVMPFVVVQSNGGPYEDQSFAAGYACGRIYEMLEKEGPITEPQLVHRGVLDQLDLIAMKNGYVANYRDVGPVEGPQDWVEVTFLEESRGT